MKDETMTELIPRNANDAIGLELTTQMRSFVDENGAMDAKYQARVSSVVSPEGDDDGDADTGDDGG